MAAMVVMPLSAQVAQPELPVLQMPVIIFCLAERTVPQAGREEMGVSLRSVKMDRMAGMVEIQLTPRYQPAVSLVKQVEQAVIVWLGAGEAGEMEVILE